jgi:hypothetical protein
MFAFRLPAGRYTLLLLSCGGCEQLHRPCTFTNLQGAEMRAAASYPRYDPHEQIPILGTGVMDDTGAWEVGFEERESDAPESDACESDEDGVGGEDIEEAE